MTDELTRAGESETQGAVPVVRPPDGEETVVRTAAGQVYDLRFPPQVAAVRVYDADGDEGQDLVLVFNADTAEESRIVFLDMARLAQAPDAPLLQVEGELFSADFVVQQARALAGEQPTLRTAAPQGPLAPGTGATQYSDDLGQPIGLLEAQGVIPPTALMFPLIDPDEIDEDPVPEEVPGVLVVGSNADDEDGQAVAHTVPNPLENDSGPILGGEGDDVLIGDPGGVLVSGGFNVAIAADVTGSIGPDNIATLNAAVERLVQQIVDEEIADKTVIRLITFAVRGEQSTSGLEFGKTFTWNGLAFVAADGQSLAEAIDVEITDPQGTTDFEPALQDAADFFNGLNGGTGPEAEDVNRIFFLTDGQDNEGPGGAFDPAIVPDIYGPSGLIAEQDLKIQVFAIQSFGGVNSGFDPDQLNLLDEGLPPQLGESLHDEDPALTGVETDIAVIGFDELSTSLTETLLTTLPEEGGADVISGTSGADIIFGDVPNTDALVIAEGLDLPPGSGWFAFAALEAGMGAATPGWDRGNTIAYLRDPSNQADLIGAGGGQGDTIDAGAGDDVIFGQGGNDDLTGGDGADVFVFTLMGNEGIDEILDFSTAEGDVLSFTDVVDVTAPAGVDIDDVVSSFVNGGGAGDVDTLTLASDTIVMITDVSGILTDLASLESHSLINGA